MELLGEPLPRLLGLTLGTRAIAAGMRETVVLSTALAGRGIALNRDTLFSQLLAAMA